MKQLRQVTHAPGRELRPLCTGRKRRGDTVTYRVNDSITCPQCARILARTCPAGPTRKAPMKRRTLALLALSLILLTGCYVEPEQPLEDRDVRGFTVAIVPLPDGGEVRCVLLWGNGIDCDWDNQTAGPE